MTVRYLIVDDEAPGRVNLRLALGAHPEWTLVAECESAAAARAALAVHEVDAIFLDVQMPVESGLLLARDVVRRPAPPLIVFVTAYSEHAIDAFEVHALDYLLKPVGDARLAQAVERCAAMLRHRQRDAYGAAVRGYVDANVGAQAVPAPLSHLSHLSVRSVGRIEQVCIDDILWIESAGNYVELHLAARAVLHRITLNRLETLLDPRHFLRVHRGAIVRRDQIGTLATVGDGSWRLRLRCGAEVAVSERYAGALKAGM